MATPQEKETTQQVYKVPTGKFVSLEEKKARKEAHKKEYENFRIKALTRRAKRMGLDEKATNEAIAKLKDQLNAPNNYDVIITFRRENMEMVKQAILNEGLSWKLISCNEKKESHGYMILDADQETLDTIRSIVPTVATIYPYVKKKPAILPVQEQKKRGKKKHTKAEKKKMAMAAKKARKALNHNKGHNVKSDAKVRLEEFMRKWKADKVARKAFKKTSHKAAKKASGTVVHLSHKKPSASPKKASTNLKQAA